MFLGISPEVRSPEENLIDHGAEADQHCYIQNGDQHQHDLAVLHPVLRARPLLSLVADKGVQELLTVRLLLDEPGCKETGEKQEQSDSAQHVKYRIHAV